MQYFFFILYVECQYQGKSQDVVYAAGGNEIGMVNPVSIAAVINTGTC